MLSTLANCHVTTSTPSDRIETLVIVGNSMFPTLVDGILHNVGPLKKKVKQSKAASQHDGFSDLYSLHGFTAE